MNTDIKFILRINSSTTYDCVAHTSTAKSFSATIVSSDVVKVRSDLADIKLLEILDKTSDSVLFSSGVYNKLTTVNLRIGFGYDNELHEAYDVIQLGFEKLDTEKKLEELDKKVTAIDEQINPVINFNAMSLPEVKTYKINESKLKLQEYLENHPITSSCHGGKEGTYSITEDKQTLLMSQYTSFKIEQQTNLSAVITWNETGKACEPWEEKEILQLILEIKKRVYPLVSYQQKYEEQVTNCSEKNEVLAIELDYDSVESE